MWTGILQTFFSAVSLAHEICWSFCFLEMSGEMEEGAIFHLSVIDYIYDAFEQCMDVCIQFCLSVCLV